MHKSAPGCIPISGIPGTRVHPEHCPKPLAVSGSWASGLWVEIMIEVLKNRQLGAPVPPRGQREANGATGTTASQFKQFTRQHVFCICREVFLAAS